MLSNDQEKNKLEEEAISVILVADTKSESGAETSDVENYFEEGGGGGLQQQQQKASVDVEPRAATSVRLPTRGPP